MTLTSVQQQLVEENMGLVRLVLSRCVNGPNSVGIYSYDDLFQIGCIGLCKAAVEYKPGKAAFSTYAFTLIRNEIYHALERATLRRNREILSDDVREPIPGADAPELTAAELRTALMAAKSRLNGVARKGVDAIALMSEGKTCKEIGMIYGTTANNVSAWISKARKALKADPEFMSIAAGDIA